MADKNVPTHAASTRPSGRLGVGTGHRAEDTRAEDNELVNRRRMNTTPQRYEQPVQEDDGPVMPGDESTLKTTI